MMMLTLLWLLPALPLMGFFLLAVFGSRFSMRMVARIGTGSVGFAALLNVMMGGAFILDAPVGNAYVQHLWTWFSISGFSPSIAFYLDPLSLVFTSVITFVGFLIHVYSVEFMEKDEGYARFFAYMNLFIASMLVLVLADDLLLLYLGWEGVGLCSFLLIGFWYRDPGNSVAARKAFIVTRIGDTSMIIGLFLLLESCHTLTISSLLVDVPLVWHNHSSTALWAALLLMGGALGKSAQVPLQTWLPDAMVGPSPVSALIHAATMVTAGVYLITRMHVLFEIAPVALAVVGLVGAITLTVGGFSALVQNDIKKVLVYSTISQIGYMFLAMGLGAWSIAVYHFFVHAFFKSLLFLGAGAIILALNEEHDMAKMGGLRKKMPLVFWTFLCGAGALAALPLISAGFYSKDPIVEYALISDKGNIGLWLTALAGSFITSIYTFRMVFLTFFGTSQTVISHRPGGYMRVSLVILAACSLLIGVLELPKWMGDFTPFSDFLQRVLPAVKVRNNGLMSDVFLQSSTLVVSVSGIYLAWLLYKYPRWTASFKNSSLYVFLKTGWGFDWLYDHVIVRPIVWLATIDQQDVIDRVYVGLANLNVAIHDQVKKSQNGNLRWYAFGIAFGALLTLTLILFL